jgi:predicted ATP-dependent endonuclease of OLD family
MKTSKLKQEVINKMKERLVIKNFGPIKSVDLELGKMTILIGEQATGKSTVAKVLAMCKYFSYIVSPSPSNNSYVPMSKGFRDWGVENYLDRDTEIFYENEDYIYKISRHDNFNINFQLTEKSEKFKKLVKNYQSLYLNDKSSDKKIETWTPDSIFLINDVKKVMDNPFFFPTERGLQSIFSLGKNTLQNFSDSLFNQLALLENISKNNRDEIEIRPLNIFYKYENGQGFTRSNKSSNYFPLRNGASGYQSSIPIVLAVKYYKEVENRERTFIIEEPEINLFPNAQKKMFDFFVENINENGHSFLIPTHSPYFLSAANDLLMAYKKGQSFPEEVMNLKIPKKYWLNPKNISVYELKNGKAKSIINKKTGLITDNIIDEVSDDMNDNFDKILDIG